MEMQTARIEQMRETSMDGGEIEQRKADHLRLTATEDVSARTGAGWADIRLLHEALPTTDLDAVDLRMTFLGRQLEAPLVIAGMTGGSTHGAEVNACLARAAERHGLAMGTGSQRAAVRRPDLAGTYAIVREHAPTAFIIGNVGAPQLVRQGDQEPLSLEEIRVVLGTVRADAVAIHLNFLQETVQPKGDRHAAGVLDAISSLAQALDMPIIAKETGAGLSRRSSQLLAGAGVEALDVGGLGGTTFAAVEGLRAAGQGDARGERLGDVFREWGIPTAISLAAVAPTRLPMIATGGIRTGLDAAKAFALGATAVGVARPLLQACLAGGDAAVDAWIEQFLAELRAAIFLSGGRTSSDLHHCPRVILGQTREWLAQLGYLDETQAAI
ncbi:MAG TPA: type 2 isopentenyl-diphosphate Delta-isomerase [Chloroflexota bacterium]|nr:type 2 isopentenyl-diphosphate Delta-isomerase [Chloroflexota bacterium]